MLALICPILFGLACTFPPAVPAATTSFVRGLVNPRGIAFAPDGTLYVAEAGSGGSHTPDLGPRGQRYRIGNTARVTRFDPVGRRQILLDRLPSMSNGEDELGAADVAFLSGMLYVLTAAGGYETGDPAWDNVILRVDPSASTVQAAPVFNLTELNLTVPPLSRRTDPIKTDVHGGMPFGLVAANGALYATDSNLEAVTRITADGAARRILEYPSGNHVLTGVSAGPDGALYVAEFGAAPHREGSGRITRLSLDGEATLYIDGLANVIDVAFDDLGRAYVLEISRPGVRVENSGRILRIEPAGGREVIIDGLAFPTSIAFGPDGQLYVATGGHRSGDGQGAILRLPVASQRTRFSSPSIVLPIALVLFALTSGAIWWLRTRSSRGRAGG